MYLKYLECKIKQLYLHHNKTKNKHFLKRKTMINKSKLMSDAHQIAKTLVGDFLSRMSIAMRIAWSRAKSAINTANFKEFIGQYGDTCREVVINGNLYGIAFNSEDTKEDIKEDFFFEYGKNETTISAIKILGF